MSLHISHESQAPPSEAGWDYFSFYVETNRQFPSETQICLSECSWNELALNMYMKTRAHYHHTSPTQDLILVSLEKFGNITTVIDFQKL